MLYLRQAKIVNFDGYSEDEDFAPIYEVAIHLYDFWNKEA